ncbi:MAG: hypothetical protein V1495_01490 [Pseudomonadota bacterium]
MDHFDVLGLPGPFLRIDLERLEETFYAKIRLLHPDRFQLKEPLELEISLARSAELNEAYRTLKDKKARVKYVLDRFGGGAGDPKNVPSELAELYFDLQDLLGEPGQTARLSELRRELETRQQELERKLNEESAAWDAAWREGSAPKKEEALGRLRDLLHQGNYASSMLRDIAKRVGEGTEQV